MWGLRSGFGKSGLQLRRGPNQLTKRLHLTVFPAQETVTLGRLALPALFLSRHAGNGSRVAHLDGNGVARSAPGAARAGRGRLDDTTLKAPLSYVVLRFHDISSRCPSIHTTRQLSEKRAAPI